MNVKLVPSAPHCDLDGTWHRNCHHQKPITDEVQIMLWTGMAELISKGVDALRLTYIPAGTIGETTWGCESNKVKKTRTVMISSVYVCLSWHGKSGCYEPHFYYNGIFLDKNGRPKRSEWSGEACLTDFKSDGFEITKGYFRGTHCYDFKVEWVSPLSEQIQRVPGSGIHFVKPVRKHPLDEAKVQGG